MRSTIPKDCDQCGAAFFPTYRTRAEKPQRYCSRLCYQTARWGASLGLRCEKCGGPIPKKSRTARYCSPGCFNSTRVGKPTGPQNRRTIACSWCGEGVTRPASNFHSEKVFCDRSCMAEWQSEFVTGSTHPRWRGGQTSRTYGVGWRPARRAALERSGHVCESCGKKPPVDVHHRLPIRYFESWEKANAWGNLIAVCKPCHTAAHKKLRSGSLLDLLLFAELERPLR